MTTSHILCEGVVRVSGGRSWSWLHHVSQLAAVRVNDRPKIRAQKRRDSDRLKSRRTYIIGGNSALAVSTVIEWSQALLLRVRLNHEPLEGGMLCLAGTTPLLDGQLCAGPAIE